MPPLIRDGIYTGYIRVKYGLYTGYLIIRSDAGHTLVPCKWVPGMGKEVVIEGQVRVPAGIRVEYVRGVWLSAGRL
jgi:hypothetical protein